MGVVTRTDSPFWWLTLERPGQRPIRESTYIRVSGPTPEIMRDNKLFAEALYHAKMGDLARHSHQIAVEKPDVSFPAHARWYGEHVSVTTGGTEKELSMLRQLSKFPKFATGTLQAITKKDGLEWRAWRAKQVEDSTVNRELALLEHLFATAVPTHLDANPLAGLGELEAARQRPRVRRAERESERGPAHGGTTSRSRGASGSYWTGCPGRYHWVQKPKASACRNAVIRIFEALCNRAGFPPLRRRDGGVSFHCLRHTGASRMLAAGADIKAVMEIGGWRRIEQLQQYLHPTAAAKAAAVEILGRRKSPARTRASASTRRRTPRAQGRRRTTP